MFYLNNLGTYDYLANQIIKYSTYDFCLILIYLRHDEITMQYEIFRNKNLFLNKNIENVNDVNIGDRHCNHLVVPYSHIKPTESTIDVCLP